MVLGSGVIRLSPMIDEIAPLLSLLASVIYPRYPGAVGDFVFFCRARLILQAMSCEVNGFPSLNFRLGLRWKAQVRLLDEYSQELANCFLTFLLSSNDTKPVNIFCLLMEEDEPLPVPVSKAG